MNRILQQVANQYWFRVSLTVICCLATVWFGVYQSYIWLGISSCLLVLSIIWQVRLYRLHIKQVLFMIDALENNDSAFRFPEESGTPESKQINRALNRVGRILYNVKAETAQQEKYYELILDLSARGYWCSMTTEQSIRRTRRPSGFGTQCIHTCPAIE